MLVPWAAWGQETSSLPEGIKAENIIAQRTMVLEPNGDIPDDNSGTGKNIKLSDFTFYTGYSSDDWDFATPVSVLPNESTSGVSVDIRGNLKLDGHPNDGIDAIYIKVINNNTKEEKWICYGFAPEGTTGINDLKIGYSDEDGSKVYDGKTLTEDEVKENLTVSAIGNDNTPITGFDYTVSFDNTAKDAGTYVVTVTITGDGYSGKTSGTVNFEITQRPIIITLKEDAKTEFTIGETAPQSFSASEYLTVAEGAERTGLVDNETPTFTGNLTVTDFSTASAKTFTISQGTAAISDTGSNDFKLSNYNPDWSLTDAKIIVKRKTVNTEDITIVYDTDVKDGSVEYDGKPHGISSVTLDGETLNANDYIVQYDQSETKPTDVKIEREEVAAYTVTITLNEDKYKVTNDAAITGSLTITKRKLTVSAKETEVKVLWDGNTMVKDAKQYLKVEGWVSGEGDGDELSGDLEITKATEGDGYIIKKGKASITYGTGDNDPKKSNYTEDWGILETDGIKADEGNAPEDGESITLTPEGPEVSEPIVLTTNGENTAVYNGSAYKVSKIGNIEIGEGATITIKKDDVVLEEGEEIKNVGVYTITVEYTKDNILHQSKQKFTITPASLTITVGEQTVQITSMDNLNKEGLSSAEGFTSTIREGEGGNVTVEGLKGTDKVLSESNSLVLADKENWALGANTDAIQLKQEVTDGNYTITVEEGTLTVQYLINDENKDGIIAFNNGKTRYYDGEPITEDDITVTIPGIEGNLDSDQYEVTISAGGGGDTELADAGTYTATVAFKDGSNIVIDKDVTLSAECKIAKRPLILYFSFEEGIEKGEELVLGENASVEVAPEGTDNLGFAYGEKKEFDALLGTEITAEFHLGDEQANGTYEVILDSFTFPVEEVGDDDLSYDNYDVSLRIGHLDADGNGEDQGEVELPDSEKGDEDGEITYTPDGEGDDDVVGVIDPVDPNTGIGGSGINYRQYELKFCETDFFTDLNDYDEKGLKLFSRHDKKYTKAGGSFTVWYEKDGVKNAEYGDYRIYISRNGANGNYTELKLDEVSDYFQIRNVQSNIYVRIYYGTGFPVANEEITATDVRAYAQANKIVVITPEPTDVQIISMAGAVVATDQVTGQREFANLAEGVYIVRMGETVIKLQVRN